MPLRRHWWHKSVDAARVYVNREDLLWRLITAARDGATESVISRFKKEGVEPRELIENLLSLPFRGRMAAEASALELAIRGRSRRDGKTLCDRGQYAEALLHRAVLFRTGLFLL